MTAQKKPRFQVIDEKFVAQLSEGGEVKVPLRVKTKLFRQIMNSGDDQLGQFFTLLDGIGDQATSDKLDEVDIFETTEIIGAFFKEFTEKAQASMGESERSSN